MLSSEYQVLSQKQMASRFNIAVCYKYVGKVVPKGIASLIRVVNVGVVSAPNDAVDVVVAVENGSFL